MIIVDKEKALIEDFETYIMTTGINYQKDDIEVVIGTAEFKPNSRVPEEGYGKHDFDEYSYIISGELKAKIGDNYVSLREGEFSYIPEGQIHYSENKSEKNCKLIWVKVKKKEGYHENRN